MNRLFRKKKKPQPAIPTKITAGPHGPGTDPGIGSEDDGGGESSRITPNMRNEHQGLIAPKPSTSGAVVYGTERRYDPVGDAGGRDRESAAALKIAKKTLEDPSHRDDAVPADVAEKAGDRFGPLKTALGAIPAFYASYQETAADGKIIENLLLHIVVLEEHFATPPGDVKELRCRSELIRRFTDIEGQLRSLSEKPGPWRLYDHVQDDKEVSGLLEDLREVIYDYQMVQQNAIHDQQGKKINPAERSALKSLPCADWAEFRHGERKGCLKGTRAAVLSGIELWARVPSSSPIYWLNGLAGTGKSTIAKTVAERLFANGLLGASFFCSRDFKDRSNHHLIFPTLAIQLARKYTGFRSILIPLIEADPGITQESLYGQMEKLIVRPLGGSGISTVIIIDALDECKDEESTSAILSVLGRLAPEIKNVKFFLTGRPEPRISEGFRLPLLAKVTDVFFLHQVEQSRVDSDVRLFFRDRFLELASRRRLDDWPTAEQLDCLCVRAAGLFVYAAATVKFIDNNKANPRKQLGLLLESQKIGAREGRQLDSLYTSILQEAFGENDEEVDIMTRSVLGAVILVVNPLSPSAIAALLGLDVEDVLPLLSSVNSLLILQDADNPVKPFHKSFPDFITDQSRCTNQKFHISSSSHHSQLLIGCLSLMCRKLEKNMCGLPDGVANSDVGDLKERTERYIDPALRYACGSWHAHLIGARTTPANAPEISSALRRFLEEKLLFWLEVLSVLGATRNAVEALQATEDWLKESSVLALANDCFRFVTRYFETISASAPHIYHSALVLAPQTSMVRRLYQSHTRPFTRVAHGALMSWDSNIAATTRPSEITLAVWSPCERFIAIAWGDTRMVDILDSTNLQRLQTFELPQGTSTANEALAFSPDGRILTRFGGGFKKFWNDPYPAPKLFVISWDLQTGGLASTVEWEGPGKRVIENPSITYSTNGKMVGVLCRYWGSATIFICNVASGVYTHSHSLNRVLSGDIWTYGESLRFATHDGMAIIIWEVGFTSGATPTKVEILPVPDLPEYPRWARFLPAPCILAFAPENKLVIWDLRSSKRLLSYEDTNYHPSTSFSPDGRFFACSTEGSPDIYFWKESPTGYILHEILPSSATRSSLLLSKHGESIVAFGDRTIQSLRSTGLTTSPSTMLTRAPRHTQDFILEFSPDGMLAVVAAQRDNMVTVLDLKSSVPQLTIDAGMEIYGLGVNGDSVVILGDLKLVTWNLPTGDCAPGTRVGLEHSTWAMDFAAGAPREGLLSVTISSDFRYVALKRCMLLAGCIRIGVYHASTGECLGDKAIECVTPWFAPGGCNVWFVVNSGSAEGWRFDGGQGVLLGRTVDIEHPPEGYPWASSCGYRVTDDWWILGPDGKRLLMLPPPWQPHPVLRVWKGKFLALLHCGPSEPVILDLNP